MTAAYCLHFGFAAPDGHTCPDCGQPVENDGRYVAVGRLDLGVVCQDCSHRSDFHDLASGLDDLDTFVKCEKPERRMQAIMTVQQCILRLVDEQWDPMLAQEAGQ